ncbi:MAG: hypothetical protein DRJ42_00365 [Deltaproteobacteria bacterium]|nr:MAG: hypothetical protein DRJ42_00365 [Deltaproteobacteria bacterium]
MANQRTKAASESIAFLVISAGVLIGFNAIFAILPPLRLDWTEDELYTLSQGTKRLASSITDRLEIVAYFSEDLPPPFNATERDVRDILSEYQSAAGSNLVVTFISPDTEAEKEEAQEAGINPVTHQRVTSDGAQVVEGYRGIVMRYLDRTEVIPVVQDTSGLEYLLTTNLSLLLNEKHTIAVLTGHEGATLQEGLQTLQACAPLYEFREVSAESEIDPEIEALLVVGPQTPLSDAELRNIDSFVMAGGSLGVFGGSVALTVENQQPSFSTVDTGVNTLLRPYGVVMESEMLLDTQCRRMQTPQGPRSSPPFVLVDLTLRQSTDCSNNDDCLDTAGPGFQCDKGTCQHPVTFRLEETWAPFGAALEVTEGASERAAVIAVSTENSWTQEVSSINAGADFTPRSEGEKPLMVAIQGEIPSAFEEGQTSNDQARVLVTGSALMVRDEILGQVQQMARQQCPMIGPFASALNAIDWLAQDADLIAVRAKDVSDPSLRVPENVESAEEEAEEAIRQAREAGQDAVNALVQGDQAGLDNAVGSQNDAIGAREAALERALLAREEWDAKMQQYRWGNMLGVPFLFALFGVVRWRMRLSRRKNISI